MITEDNQAEKSAQLLSQANLHRMRQEWDEAVTSCMQVLYADPNNYRAHALLGDIYADQKRPDEAIRWYCMTLDIRPDSHSTRDKLNHIVTSRRQEFVESLDPTRPLADRTGKFYSNSLMGKLSWQWSAPERKKRLLGASSVGIVLLVAIAVPILSNKNQTDPKPVFTPGPPTTSTLFLQPVTTGDSDNANSNNSGESEKSASANTPNSSETSNTSATASVLAPNLRDSDESALISALSSDQALASQGIHVTDAEIDPPTNTVSVTYTCDATQAPLTQDRILRAGLIVGKEALGEPQGASAQTCVVRCLAVPATTTANVASIGANNQPSTSTAAPSLVFLATLPRSAASSIGSTDKINDFQIGQTYSSIWWAQSPQPTQTQNPNSVTQPSPTP